jgi:hypothetical protein
MSKKKPNKTFKSQEEQDAYIDKMNRLKMRAKSGAVKGNANKGTESNMTQKVLDDTAKQQKADAAARGRQTVDKNRKIKNREKIMTTLGIKSEDKLDKLLLDAGFKSSLQVVQEGLGSWLAAKKLQKMQKKGPKDGEDLEARKDKMDRLRMRAKSGAVKDDDAKGTKSNMT